ncbi:hypothetical protein NE237_031966 [Protea cynaroides]|uniref:TLC domain-containing protein n=1 Tax=Protea cynaroides TaxID=273540 RepID=A0A9Q0L3C7_9MAGN|nr:hypothetical protein NE237_031966 [Protea cynaroides]
MMPERVMPLQKTINGRTIMAIKSYQNQAEFLVRDYLLAHPFVQYTSILGGIFACKMVSVGYFLVDIGMIFWFYPSLGGMECVLRHLVSLVAVAYSMLYGEGQLYTYMVLISEVSCHCWNEEVQ